MRPGAWKVIISVFTLIVVLLPVSVIWFAWREMEDSAYESCIASVMSDLNRRIDAGYINVSKFELPADGTWMQLSDAEARGLLSESSPGDCGRTQDVTLDLWGRNVNVALRNSTESLKVGIWSDGSDGIPGTDDDLVAPWGVRFRDGEFRKIK